MQPYDYQAKLKHPKWQRVRLQVFERAGFKCECCGDSESTLHVHHLVYSKGDPWDAPMDTLECLCEVCHEFRSEFNRLFGMSALRTAYCRSIRDRFLSLCDAGQKDHPAWVSAHYHKGSKSDSNGGSVLVISESRDHSIKLLSDLLEHLQNKANEEKSIGRASDGRDNGASPVGVQSPPGIGTALTGEAPATQEPNVTPFPQQRVDGPQQVNEGCDKALQAQ
jgi:hypothetical protein